MFTKLEQHSWIKIEVARGHSTQECFQGLREACGEAALPYRTVARWVKHSRKAGIPFKTTPHGQQHSSTPCFPVGCWSQMDCAWVSSRSLSMSQNCAPHSGYQQTCSALDTHMKFPRCNNGTTMQSQRPYWIRYQRESDDFLERIVTMYRTPSFLMRMHGVTPLLAQNSSAAGNGRFWNIHRTHPIWVHATTISSPKW